MLPGRDDSSSAPIVELVSFLLLHQKIHLLHCLTVTWKEEMLPRTQARADCLRSCQSSSSANRQQPCRFWPTSCHSFLTASCQRSEDLSDLCERDLIGVRVAVNVEDEGVFVGVVLDDVVVHVHQDPDEGGDWLSMLHARRILTGLGALLLCTHPFLLFLYTLAIPSVGTPYFSDIYERLQVLVNRRLKDLLLLALGTYSIHQASECGRLQHECVKHLIRLFSNIQQDCEEDKESDSVQVLNFTFTSSPQALSHTKQTPANVDLCFFIYNPSVYVFLC